MTTDENFRQTQDFIGVTISRPAFKRSGFTPVLSTDATRRSSQRVREQRIRDCHGDLHLGPHPPHAGAAHDLRLHRIQRPVSLHRRGQ
jgi:aminoglycoside phosphotransferase family enzyme